jgi:hypothetical protein
VTSAPIDSAASDRSSSDTAALLPTAATGSPEAITTDPVTTADIADLLHRRAALRVRAVDPELFARIADQYTRPDPAYFRQVPQLVTDTRTAVDVNPALTPTPARPTPATP